MEIKVDKDQRGRHIEVFKIPECGQVNYAVSKPGAVRGNHYHSRKKEIFWVVEGEAKIRMRNRGDNEIKEYLVSGGNPQLFEMPVNWAHSVENIGQEELKLLIWVNEIFNPEDPDTYAEEV